MNNRSGTARNPKLRLISLLNLVIRVAITLVVIGLVEYYLNGTYLNGRNCFAVTANPGDRLIASYKKVDRLTIDPDGTAVLIAPCMNNTGVRISKYIVGTDGVEIENQVYFEKKSMNTNEAILVKISGNDARSVSLIVQKVRKVFIIDLPIKQLGDGTTSYLKFY